MNKFPVLLAILLAACSSVQLQPPTYKQAIDSVGKYKYVVIPDAGITTSYAASISPNGGGAVGKEISPSGLIEGLLLKKGIVRIPASEPKFAPQLLIAKYGVSGKRELGRGAYTQEVTINLLDANSYAPIFTCSAEGFGQTEVDDIRDAIIRCLDGLKN